MPFRHDLLWLLSTPGSRRFDPHPKVMQMKPSRLLPTQFVIAPFFSPRILRIARIWNRQAYPCVGGRFLPQIARIAQMNRRVFSFTTDFFHHRYFPPRILRIGRILLVRAESPKALLARTFVTLGRGIVTKGNSVNRKENFVNIHWQRKIFVHLQQTQPVRKGWRVYFWIVGGKPSTAHSLRHRPARHRKDVYERYLRVSNFATLITLMKIRQRNVRAGCIISHHLPFVQLYLHICCTGGQIGYIIYQRRGLAALLIL